MAKEALTFTRQSLYDLVWTRPGREIAKELGISDVALSKACRRADIPRPGVGYWAKLTVGKKTVRPALSPRALGQSDEVHIGGSRYGWAPQVTDEEILRDPIPELPKFAEGLAEVTERARAMVRRVTVPRDLSQGHRLIVALLQEDTRRREIQQASAYPSSWNAPRFDSPTGRRKLRILNALLLALARQGYNTWVHVDKVDDKLSAGARIGDEQVSFALDSFAPKGKGKPGRSSDQRERLRLAISLHQPPPEIQVSWEDQDGAMLESQLTDVSVGLLIAAGWSYRTGLERRHGWRIERKRELEKRIREAREEAERQERARIAKLEKERRDQLLAEVTAWEQAARIRHYVQAVRAACASRTDPEVTQELEAWISWALAEADRLDPLRTVQFTS